MKRRQELALAHMEVEHELEQSTKALSWGDHFDRDWITGIHELLYKKLDVASRVILDEHGNNRGNMAPGELRTGWVKVGYRLP